MTVAAGIISIASRYDISERAVAIISRLAIALAQSDAHAATITPMHAALTQFALKKALAPASWACVRAVLDLDLHDVSKAKEFSTTAMDVLLYLFYGAKCYCHMRLWSAARSMFRAVRTSMAEWGEGGHSNLYSRKARPRTFRLHALGAV